MFTNLPNFSYYQIETKREYTDIFAWQLQNWHINSTNVLFLQKWHFNMSITAWGGADWACNMPDATSQKTMYN